MGRPAKKKKGPLSFRKGAIVKLISESHSRSQVSKVMLAIDDDQQRFDELVEVFLGTDAELARRAAWSMSYIVIKHPDMIYKWLPKVIENMKRANLHPAIYRNTFRFLEVIAVPQKHAATVLDMAFKFIMNAGMPPAIRAFAMTTAMNVVRSYPDLQEELMVVVEQVMTEQSPAIRSRGGRILAELRKKRDSVKPGKS